MILPETTNARFTFHPARAGSGYSIEPLESRIAPANFVLPVGQGPYTLELDPVDGHIHITSGAAGEIFDQGVAPGDDLFVTGGGPGEAFTIASSAAGNVNFTGTLSVIIPGQINVAGPAVTGVDLVLSSTAAGITYSTGVALGASDAHFTAARNLAFTAGSMLSTDSGDIVLLGNQGAGQNGTFTGITLDAATITTTGAGTIQLTGTGGNASNNNNGISLLPGAVISSTSNLPTAGTITLTGTAGPGIANNRGVVLSGNGTTFITSTSGDISVTGSGSTGSSGTNNVGVHVLNGADIISNGTGVNAAKITINGTGGAGVDFNHGVFIDGSGQDPQITSIDGAISITGTALAAANGQGSRGISIEQGAQVVATGGVANTPMITLQGTGGGGSDNRQGVFINQTGSLVSAAEGFVMITGTGGAGGAGNANNGVRIAAGGTVSAQGSNGVVIVGVEGAGGNNAGISLTGGVINATGPAGVDLGANNLNIDAIATVNGGPGGTFLHPRSGAIPIDLGGPDGPGNLGITDAELNRITGGPVEVGDASSGPITLTTALVVDPSLVLTTGATVSGAFPFSMGVGSNLTINADAGIDLSGLVFVPGGAVTFSAGTAAAISVTNAANDLNSVSIPNAGSANLRDDTGFALGPTNVATLLTVESAGTITQGGILGGAGGLTKAGPGMLVLTAANTYAGTTTINAGTLQVGSGGTVGTLGSAGVVNNAVLAFDRSDAFTVTNAISGTGDLSKSGSGVLTLTATNTYSGTTAVLSGTLLVDGQLANTLGASTASPGTIGGSGTIAAPLNLSGGLAPGGNPGTLATGNVLFQPGGRMNVEVNGAFPNHDQLAVTGTVTLADTFLNISGTIASAPGQPIVLIANDGADPVAGTFSGLAEGATVSINGVLFAITYAGGTDNNDVALAPAPAETEISLAGGDLTITDIAAGGHNSTLTFQDQSANGFFLISDLNHNLSTTIPGATVSGDLHSISIPASAVTGTRIVVNSLAGDDSLTVDLSTGPLTKTLIYNGGTQAAVGDTLQLNGPPTTSTIVDFANARDGAVTFAGSASITYSGLEALNTSISTANLTLNYNANGPNTVTVADAGGGKTMVTSTAGVALDIVNPTLALTINGGGDADTININSLSAFPGSLTIDGKAGADNVNLAANLPTFAGLTVATEGISALPALSVGAGGLDITATVSAIDVNGGITVTGPVRLQSGGAITNTAGTIAAGTVTATAPDGITLALDGASLTATVTGGGGVTLQAVNNPVTIVSLDPGMGGVNLNSGTFLLSKTDAITGGSPLTVGGTLNLNGSSQTITGPNGAGTITNTSPLLSTLTASANSDNHITFSGNIQGHVALAKIGNASLTLSGAGNNYDGGTTITSGTLQFNASGAAVNGEFNLAGGTLFYNFSNAGLTPKINLTEPSSIGVATGEQVTLSAAIRGRGGLTKTGGGTLVLGNELNTFGPGAVTIDAGVLQVATDGALGDVTNRIVFNNGTLKTTGSFASGRQIVQNGTAIIDVAGSSLTLIGNVGDQAALQTNHVGGALQFAFVFVDNLPVTVGTPVIVGGTTVTASGGATVTVHTVGGLGAQIDTIELTNTTRTTNLTIKGAGTINRIVSDGDIGSVVLGTGVILGDGVRDSVADLEIAGKATKLQLYDLSPYAFIDLGKNLPYEVLRTNGTIDTTQSQTKTNRPNLTIHDAGAGVLIDVTGDGTPGGVGGGGLGKVIVNKWDPTGIPGAIRTTQSIGSFKLLQGNSTVVFEVDKFHLGSSTSAAVGSMTIQNGSWGSSGSEIEGAVGSFNANDFLAAATLTAGSMGKFTLDAGAFAGLLTLTDPDAPGIPTLTVATDFTGSVVSEAPIRKINVKGEFRGELEALFIGSINAYAFIGTNTPGEYNAITATEGSLGTLTASQGVVRNFSIVTDQAFKGFNVKLSKLTGDTIGIDNVHIEALSIGNITVSLAAAANAPAGIDLVGIRNSDFITTGTGDTKATLGGIGNITVTLTGAVGGNSATGIVNSTFDALVEEDEFGSNPNSTVNALGKIAVKIAGQDGPSLGLDNVAFLGNSIGTTTLSVSRGKDSGSQASSIDLAEFTATGAIGAMSIIGDATSTQVIGLHVSAGANVGAITVKATKTPANGTIADSAILAGQSLVLSPATTVADLTKASLGAVNVTGSITDTDLVAGGSIGAITVGGSLTDSFILAGGLLGADGLLGGMSADADSFQRAAAIAAVTVKGASGGVFARTSIIAGVSPGNGIYGDTGDTAAPAAGLLPNTSSIGAISLPAGVLASVAGVQQYAIEAAKIKGLKLGPTPAVAITATPKLLDLSPAGLDGDDLMVRLIA